jgi:Na+-driven multidrug efflux pump
MIISGIFIYITAEVVPTFFSSNTEVLDFSTRYLKIAAFILPAYPIFFLSNGFFMALKKSENAMLNNILRNVLVPIIVFYLAKYLSADFNSFFWLWAAFQWSLSLLLLHFVIYFIKYRLKKSSAVI